MTNNPVIFKGQDEPYDDYFVRLFENKKEYGLTCVDIADLLNEVNGENKGESAYRKEYAAFNRGRIYESCRGESQIATRILSISQMSIISLYVPICIGFPIVSGQIFMSSYPFS